MTPLNNSDFNSIAWKKLESLLQSRIESARRQLEVPGIDSVKTETIRGNIEELRYLLALPQYGLRFARGTIEPGDVASYTSADSVVDY